MHRSPSSTLHLVVGWAAIILRIWIFPFNSLYLVYKARKFLLHYCEQIKMWVCLPSLRANSGLQKFCVVQYFSWEAENSLYLGYKAIYGKKKSQKLLGTELTAGRCFLGASRKCWQETLTFFFFIKYFLLVFCYGL